MKANVTKAIDALTEEFRATLTEAVRQIWPALVAAELMKISGGYSPPKSAPKTLTKGQAIMLAKIQAVLAEEPDLTPEKIATKLKISTSYVWKLIKAGKNQPKTEEQAT